MIAYFDTSALIPILVNETASERAGRLWDSADRLVSVRLVYPEARAALAQAHHTNRISRADLRRAAHELDDLVSQIDIVEVTDRLARRAGELAEVHALRGYDAVHLAAAEQVMSDEVVVVAGDGPLLRSAEAIGLAIAATA